MEWYKNSACVPENDVFISWMERFIRWIMFHF
jgi:hypothetical protein